MRCTSLVIITARQTLIERKAKGYFSHEKELTFVLIVLFKTCIVERTLSIRVTRVCMETLIGQALHAWRHKRHTKKRELVA